MSPRSRTPPFSKPSSGAVTIREVARLAGVSLGSVSRVMNGKATVTPEVRVKVQSAIQELNYRPSAAAQNMRRQATRTVGCIIRDINIPGFAAFVRAAHDVFTEAGYALFLSNSDGKPERERELISVMLARRTDALLMAQYSDWDAGLDALLRRNRTPLILVDRKLPEWADAVVVDHRSAVRRATEKLLALGHRRIALITGSKTLYPAQERIAGYRAAFAAGGIAVDDTLVRSGSFVSEFGFEQTALLVSTPRPVTALIAGGIEMLPGVLRALRVSGMRIPDDVSLVATLNSDLAELVEPSISIERWDYAEVGRIAARFALERIRNGPEGEPRRLTVPSEFLLRDSCAPPRN